MRNIQTSRKIDNVTISFTARDWELYTSAASDEAAKEMNKELGILIVTHNEICRNSVNSVYAKMGTVMNRFADQGAIDTEPRWWLRETLREVYGVDNCKDIV